ncbi:hypothetical protein quinque_003765 [Culex quinquefasciatus]
MLQRAQVSIDVRECGRRAAGGDAGCRPTGRPAPVISRDTHAPRAPEDARQAADRRGLHREAGASGVAGPVPGDPMHPIHVVRDEPRHGCRRALRVGDAALLRTRHACGERTPARARCWRGPVASNYLQFLPPETSSSSLGARRGDPVALAGARRPRRTRTAGLRRPRPSAARCRRAYSGRSVAALFADRGLDVAAVDPALRPTIFARAGLRDSTTTGSRVLDLVEANDDGRPRRLRHEHGRAARYEIGAFVRCRRTVAATLPPRSPPTGGLSRFRAMGVSDCALAPLYEAASRRGCFRSDGSQTLEGSAGRATRALKAPRTPRSRRLGPLGFPHLITCATGVAPATMTKPVTLVHPHWTRGRRRA